MCEGRDGNQKHAIGNWRNPCHDMAKNLAELCSVMWKVGLVSNGQETTGQDHLELQNSGNDIR